MPASRSPNPGARPQPDPKRGARQQPGRKRDAGEPPQPRRAARTLGPIVLLGLVIAAIVAAALLPASLAARWLPARLHAEDFTGTLWHGAVGHLTLDARDVGALEWHVHPLPLLMLSIDADWHWVKAGFVMDGRAQVSRHALHASNIHGSGSIEDLRDLGVAAGWRGGALLAFEAVDSDFQRLTRLLGTIDVSNLSAAAIAGGADLGAYRASFPTDSVAADGTVTAQLADAGGPVQAQATIRYSPAANSGLFSGTLLARADAAPALRSELADISQLRPRDSLGRIPVELEFTL